MTTTPGTTPTQISPIHWIAANRERASYALIGLGVAMVIVTIFLALRWDRSPARPAEDKDKSKNVPGIIENEEQKEPKTGVVEQKNPDYLWAAVWAAAIGITCVGLGLWNINRQVQLDQEPYMARVLVLAAGGTVGLLTALLGLKLGYHWDDNLARWVNHGETKGLKWILAALSILVVGLAITFVCLQQARPEIRNHPKIRRLVYGYDFGLTGLLVIILLVAVNLFASAKLPATLDATEGGFYSLDSRSEKLLKSINQPIHAYFVAHARLSGTVENDVRSLLTNCARVAPNFQWTFLGPINAEEILKLYQRLKIPESEHTTGLILTVGDQEEHASFIRLAELLKVKENDRPRQRPNEPEPEQQLPQLSFEGEPRIMTELQFLAEGKVKPIIYFTQGAGELALHPPGRISPNQSARSLAETLSSRNFDARPLVLTEDKEKRWMKDATAMVILGPTRSLNDDETKLIREYMKPTDGRRGGKLVALLPVFPSREDRNQIAKTGLEPLFAEFGISVTTEILLPRPEVRIQGEQFRVNINVDFVGDPELMESRHPMAAMLKDRTLSTLLPRPIQTTPIQNFKVEKLLVSDDRIPTWFEKKFIGLEEILDVWKQIETDRTVATEKRAGKQAVPVAVLSSQTEEKTVPRMAVFGLRDFVSDLGMDNRNPNMDFHIDLFTGTLDWLRERPADIGISPRVHNSFHLGKTTDEGRLLYAPLGILLLSITGIGMGVWLMRRSS